jgi:hypothetical protein
VADEESHRIGLYRRKISPNTILVRLLHIQVTINEYKDESSVIHIDIVSVASGLSTTEENRTLDWVVRPHNDKIFGKVDGQSRLFKADEYEAVGPATDEDLQFLLGKKLKDGSTDSNYLDDDLFQNYVKSVGGNGWVAEMTWGFEEVKGERRYTRRSIVWKGDKSEKVRLVYDYQGKAGKTDVDGLAYGE